MISSRTPAPSPQQPGGTPSAEGELLERAAAARDRGEPVALATVVETWGSSPRPVGSQLLVHGDGRFSGSVSGGCVEAAVIEQALAVIAAGRPRLLEYGVSDAEAWAVGLACGGTIRVFVERVE